jgi:membrane fusion protein, heavy metal efflux system
MNALNLPKTLLACSLLMALSSCGAPDTAPAGMQDHGEAEAADHERGPHRGRLLRDGDFALELKIFEDGVPPEYHVYLYSKDEPLPAAAAEVVVTLTRLDGETNTFRFTPQGDHLRGNGVVTEPHSFQVQVEARRGNTTHHWAFDSFEGRTTLAAGMATASGLVTELAGSARIAEQLTLQGRVAYAPDRQREVTARFAGPVREVLVMAGDTVRAGQRLAVIESNESLTNYAVTAPIGGRVLSRQVNPGEQAGSAPLFVIAADERLSVDLPVFPRDRLRVSPGQRVLLRAVDAELVAEGRIVRLLPARDAQAAAGIALARVEFANAGGRWLAGQYVEGRVEVAAAEVPLAVRRSALQTFRDFTVVFEQVGDTYEVRMLELGRQDDTWVEVLGGLKPGARYVSGNSYLLKADIEKSGASHDH